MLYKYMAHESVRVWYRSPAGLCDVSGCIGDVSIAACLAAVNRSKQGSGC